MCKHRLLLLLCIITFSLNGFAETKTTGNGPDKVYLQKILDGWSTLNSAEMKQYYVQDNHLFFDIAPVKCSNWAEYQAGVTDILKTF